VTLNKLGLNLKSSELKTLILESIGQPLPSWELDYLNYHAARFLDTLELLGPGDGKRLLDVGAFPGHLTLAVQFLGYGVEALTGPNESARGLQTFSSRMVEHHIPVAMVDVEFEVFPFADKSFDVVLAAEIFEHLPFNPYHMLREAFRILKPGGSLFLSTPNLPKLDNWILFALGRSIHPDVRLPFHKTFKSILIGRHIREYATSELVYMLEEQNKEMYRFEGTKVNYSMCLDPAFSWTGAIPWLIKTIWPRTRATLFVQSYRPKGLELISPKEITAKGFYEVEAHDPHMGSTGRILSTPFRWSRGQAEITLPAGKAAFQVFLLHLIFLAPRYLPPIILDLSIGEYFLGRIGLPVGREYVPIRLAFPVHLAEEGLFKLSWKCTTWRPIDHADGIDYYEFSISDTRDLGVAIAWDGLLWEECNNRDKLQKVAQRECHRSKLREGNEGRWSPLSGLYFIQAPMKSALNIGPGDWRQLGLGWHKLEKWPQGWIRWSSKSSEVYLATGADFSRLCLRVYTGDKALGGEVSGNLEIQWAPDRLAFISRRTKPFIMPSDQWTELVVDLPQPPSPSGLFRILITVDQPRAPIHLIPGSQDGRELGLAIQRIFLE
jgi:SAM-dependent methyltransferase